LALLKLAWARAKRSTAATTSPGPWKPRPKAEAAPSRQKRRRNEPARPVRSAAAPSTGANMNTARAERPTVSPHKVVALTFVPKMSYPSGPTIPAANQAGSTAVATVRM